MVGICMPGPSGRPLAFGVVDDLLQALEALTQRANISAELEVLDICCITTVSEAPLWLSLRRCQETAPRHVISAVKAQASKSGLGKLGGKLTSALCSGKTMIINIRSKLVASNDIPTEKPNDMSVNLDALGAEAVVEMMWSKRCPTGGRKVWYFRM